MIPAPEPGPDAVEDPSWPPATVTAPDLAPPLGVSGRRLGVYLAAIEDALAWLDATATALERMLQGLEALRAMKAHLAESSVSRSALSRRADQVREHVAAAAESRRGRRRLFGGTAERAVARTADRWEFVGDRRPVIRRIGPDLSIRVNVDGLAVLGFDTGTDLLTAIDALVDGLASAPAETLEETWVLLDQRASDLWLAQRSVRARARRIRTARDATVGALRSAHAPLPLDREDGDPLDATREDLARRALRDAVDFSLPSLHDFLA